MTSVKKFASWLSGESGSGGWKKKSKTPEVSPLTKIKMFNRRLTRSIGKMEMEQNRAKKNAIKSRKEGNLERSKVYMKSALQFSKWVNASEAFRLKMQGIQFQLEQAKAVEQFSTVAKDIVGAIKTIKTSVTAPQITTLLNQLDFGGFQNIMEGVTENLDEKESQSETSGVTDAEVNEALAEIDAEIGVTTRSSLPTVPGQIPQMEEGLDDMDSLEAEIEKLKKNRS